MSNKIRYIKATDDRDMTCDMYFKYKNCNEETVQAECSTIMDFIETMESDNDTIPMLDDSDVYVEYFNNKHNTKHFDTIEELLEHCKEMVK